MFGHLRAEMFMNKNKIGSTVAVAIIGIASRNDNIYFIGFEIFLGYRFSCKNISTGLCWSDTEYR